MLDACVAEAVVSLTLYQCTQESGQARDDETIQ